MCCGGGLAPGDARAVRLLLANLLSLPERRRCFERSGYGLVRPVENARSSAFFGAQQWIRGAYWESVVPGAWPGLTTGVLPLAGFFGLP
jgi:hypothetical protein